MIKNFHYDAFCSIQSSSDQQILIFTYSNDIANADFVVTGAGRL